MYEAKEQTTEERIVKLEAENRQYTNDNIYKLFFATNRKAGEIADSLNSTTLDLSSDDKVFDRFIKLMEKLEPIFKTLAAMRQDYLKLDDTETEQLEERKLPPVEQFAKRKKK